MGKFWKAYVGGLFIVAGLAVGFAGCSGFVNPFVDAEHTFKEDVRKDLRVLHEKVEGFEDIVEKAVKDLVGCNCGDKPAPAVVDQWFQDTGYSNIYLWGHVVNGVLYYTYIFDSNTNVVSPVRRMGAIPPGKTKSDLPDNATKEFNPIPIKGLAAPAK